MRNFRGEATHEELSAGAAAIRAVAKGEATSQQQIMAYRFIVDVIACTDRQDYAEPADSETMSWRNGRRYVGLEIEKMILYQPIPSPAPVPPARTTTEAVRRRAERKAGSGA